MSKIVYRFSCGCEWDESHHDQIKPNNKKMSCPNHQDAHLVHRITHCVDCGKELKAGPMGGIPSRCKPCAAKWAIQIKKNYNHGGYYYNPDLPCGTEAPERKPDCKYYDRCLDPTGRLMKNPRACINCPHYKIGSGLDIMDFVHTGGQFPGEKDCLGPDRKAYGSRQGEAR